jgi:NADPH-dependent 2,4-dienoyl-CoA reductase/sulfur reductase-like enzyme
MHRTTHGIARAVVVGGGLIGIELAEMLHSRGIAVTMLVRAPHYWGSVLPPAEAGLVNQQLRDHHIDVRYGTELAEIWGMPRGACGPCARRGGEEIECQWVGLATGVTPNLAWPAIGR